MSTCYYEGCPLPARCKGLCDTHYRRWRKHGDAAIIGKPGRKRLEDCSVDGCPRKVERRGMCRPHGEEARRAMRRKPVKCAFCEAHRILTGDGYSDTEIAHAIHKPPGWLAAHLKGHRA